MARQPRGKQVEGIFHVMARGVGGLVIFRSDHDRTVFLLLLQQAAERYGWVTLSHTLVGTHYHLLVKVPEDALAPGMRLLNGAFAQGFNRRYGRRGHVFEGRYRRVDVAGDSHLRHLIRYLADNARRAGLCRRAEHWRWGSYRHLVRGRAGDLSPGDRYVLGLFGKDPPTARRRLRRFVRDMLAEEPAPP